MAYQPILHTEGERTARQLGIAFATELNDTPQENQNWRLMERGDDLPDADFRTLEKQFGIVTWQMGDAYRSGFNQTRFHRLSSDLRDAL